MDGQLISERLTPVTTEVNAHRAGIGAPLLPMKFIWRGCEHAVGEVLETWKETGSCTHGSGERYVRKHWFRIRTARGDEMKIYFERKPRSARQAKQRWWLYTFTPCEES
jgi:Family of unknown function (DUF6504)